MHDREPNNSQATGRVGSVKKVQVESEDKAKGGYIKAKSEQLSKSTLDESVSRVRAPDFSSSIRIIAP